MGQGHAPPHLRRIAGLGLLCLLSVVAVGCSVKPPLAERYFDRSSPMDCVKMFQYSIEAEQLDTAYACLSPNSQEILSRFRFQIGLGWPIRDLGDITLRELIVPAERFLIEVNEAQNRALITMLGEEAEQTLLVRLDGEWLIDLEETLEAMGFDVRRDDVGDKNAGHENGGHGNAGNDNAGNDNAGGRVQGNAGG